MGQNRQIRTLAVERIGKVIGRPSSGIGKVVEGLNEIIGTNKLLSRFRLSSYVRLVRVDQMAHGSQYLF